MPRGDRTGPNGEGPRTGRAMGFCAGNNRPGFMEQGVGFRGGGRFRAPQARRGMARGRGFAWRAQPQQEQPQFQAQGQEMTDEQEREMLKQELEDIKQEQQEIEKRIKELK